jgi:hypothetical protein
MERPNWRDPTDYESLRSVDTPTLAGEFLKRNPDYVADHERLSRLLSEGRLKPADCDAFAAAWGVRFRRAQRTPDLDRAGSSHCCWRGGHTSEVRWTAAPR